MRINAADYARGLLMWKPIQGLTLRLGTSTKAGDPTTWSGPLANAEGSPIPIDLRDKIQFRYDMSGTDPIVQAEFWSSIESINKGAVIARVFHGLPPRPPVVLRHVPGYGFFHRVVVDADTLDWTDDVVFREMGILVRFVNGEVEGERLGNLKGGVDEQGQPVLTGEQGTTVAKGRLIEVVTPGKTAQQAEQHAYATLGLLALALGDNVLGPVIFSEPWETSPEYQRGEAVAKGTAFPRKADSSEVDRVDELLQFMTTDGPSARARIISLRWYERGLRSTAALDMLLSFFIGIESLVAAYAKANAPIPVEKARAKENDAIVDKVKTLGAKVASRVAQRVRGTSIRDQFDFYSQQHKLGAKETSQFDKAKRVRDDAVHGDEVEVTLEVAHEAEELLRAMLKSEFAITDDFAWEGQPRVRGMRLGFELVPADRARDEGAAVVPAASPSLSEAPRPGL